MKAYGRITVFPVMPARINRLYELAYNLWWSWHPEARDLYDFTRSRPLGTSGTQPCSLSQRCAATET